MDETSTFKFRNHNFKKGLLSAKDRRLNKQSSFEKELIVLLDKELLNPKAQILQQIFDYSKRTF